MNIKGTITEIFETIQVTDKYKKREFVIQDCENDQYPQFIKFELSQDKCGLMDGCKIGQEVDVHFNLRGRPYINPQGVKNYFNSLQAWKIEKGAVGQQIADSSGPVDDRLPF